jgi:HK97 gp10 family phage protein
MKFDWQIKPFMDKVERENQQACKRGAQIVAKDARARCTIDDGKLLASIRVKKSKFEKGGYIVLVGGKETFYWRWVEFGADPNTIKKSRTALGAKRIGTQRKPLKRRPFMRPALESNRANILKEFKDTI